MNFEVTSERQVRGDALMGERTGLFFKYNAYAAERRAWRAVGQQTPELADMASGFDQIIRESLKAQIHAHDHVRGGMIDAKGILHVKDSVAGLAMSKFVRTIMPYWMTDGTTGAEREYVEDSRTKRLIDVHQHKLIHDAHGLTVHRDLVATPPFSYSEPLPARGTRWFVNRQEGLYVAAQTPAETTTAMREELALATGSLAAADAVIDAPNSVTLLPYLSYRGLAGQEV